MKLERYKDKKETRKKVMLIGLTVITLVSVTMMLYKTFAKFTTTTSFPIMSGQVKYKKKGLEFGKDILPTEDNDGGLYEVSHTGPEGWTQKEYRYGGKNPKNYVYFNCKDNTDVQNSNNCELWRIIGLVNVKTYNGGVEQRVKIIRGESIGYYSWDYVGTWGLSGTNDWTKATLMGMLNDTYYNSLNENKYCYDSSGNSSTKCNFGQTQQIRGLSSKARDMIEKDTLSWNIGGWSTTLTSDEMYEKERGTTVYQYNREKEWNIANTKDPSTNQSKKELFRGVGLMYPSDLGYAVGSSVRAVCLKANLLYYFDNKCDENDWLYMDNGDQWLLTPSSENSDNSFRSSTLYVGGFCGTTTVNTAAMVQPVVYINPEFKITSGNGTSEDPYVLT